MSKVQSLAAAAGIGASLVLLLTLRQRQTSNKAGRSQNTDDQVQLQPQDASYVGGQQAAPGSKLKKVQRTSSVCILVASVALSGVALWTTHTLHPITANALHPLAAGICIIIALAMSSFLLRGPRDQNDPGPRRRNGFIVSLIAAVLFVAQLGFTLLVVIQGVFYVDDPAVLLQLTMLGVTAVGIALCLLATWISGWPFAEPFAIGIVAASLGAFCVPGLQTLTTPLQAPTVNGAGGLFVAGPGSQKVALTVFADPLTSPPKQDEMFIIANNGQRSLNFALLLVGDARLVPSTVSLWPTTWITKYRATNKSSTHCGRDLFISNPQKIVTSPACAQLYSATLYPSTSVIISGKAYGTFASNTYAHSVVSLPTYGQGTLSDLSHEPAASIVKALGAKPTTANVALEIYGSGIGPLENVSEVIPNLNPEPKYPGLLEWTSNSPIAPSYTVTYQDSADEVSNFLFVFAILLGVAGAGILASLQRTIQVVLERRATIQRGSRTTKSP